MKISVIIPTYKPGEYLWDCLNSMYNQTIDKSEFEVILVLNGCNEPYFSQITNWIKLHDKLNVNFIQTDQGGVSNARNIALEVAKGDYITFVDDDDYLSLNCLYDMYRIASPDTIALCNAIGFYDKKNEEKVIPQTLVFRKLFAKGKLSYKEVRAYYSVPWAKLIHRSIIDNRKYNIYFKNGEDCLYMFLLSNKYNYVSFTLQEAIYYHRYRDNSAITVLKPNKALFINTFKLIREYTKIYLYGSNYSFKMYIMRILGAFHTLFHVLKLYYGKNRNCK